MRRFHSGSPAIVRPTSSTTSDGPVDVGAVGDRHVLVDARPDPGQVGGDLDLAVGDGVDHAVDVAQRRPPQVEVLDRAGHAGQAHDVALGELVLDEDERAVEVVADERLRPEADRDADDAEPGDGRPDVEPERRPGSSAPAMTTMKKRMTLVASVSIVSIRFLTSTALSSWAVPSVASRSSSALTMPWTNRPASQIATSATDRRSGRSGRPLLRPRR